MAAGNGGLARKRCPKCGPDQLPQSPEEEEKQPLSLIMALQKTSSAESSRLWGKKNCLCKGNFCLTWGQAQESNCKGTGRENLDMKWKKRACYTPGSKEPHLHACHCPSSQILIKWNNPSVTNLHLPNVEVQCFSNINCKLSRFAKASKHIKRRSHLKQILVGACPLPHVQDDIIADSSEPWYLPPSPGPHTAFWIPSWNCFWDPKLTLSWASTNQNSIHQPTHLIQMSGRKHSDLTNVH